MSKRKPEIAPSKTDLSCMVNEFLRQHGSEDLTKVIKIGQVIEPHRRLVYLSDLDEHDFDNSCGGFDTDTLEDIVFQVGLDPDEALVSWLGFNPFPIIDPVHVRRIDENIRIARDRYDEPCEGRAEVCPEVTLADQGYAALELIRQ